MKDEREKRVMAKNIMKYMDEKGVTAADVCKALNIKQNTFSDWINAKTYPRVEKMRLLADYFGIPMFVLVDDDFHLALSIEEEKLIYAYRRAESSMKDAICKLLDVKRDLHLSKEA